MTQSEIHSPYILVVDDEPGIVEFIELGLGYEGFRVTSASNGLAAFNIAQQSPPDLIVLDVMLPGLNGLEFCQKVRASNKLTDVPIIMLTAKDEVSDRVLGLNAGADDYLTKPFSFQELVARIRAVLRRKSPVPTAKSDSDRLSFEELSLDPTSREVRVGDRLVELTVREYDLLYYLMRHPRQVLEREAILDAVWGYDYVGDDNIIEVYVRYLRQKLGAAAGLIQTVRGVGYVMKSK